MKTFVSLFLCALMSGAVWAQVPQPMSSQGTSSNTVTWERTTNDSFSVYSKSGAKINGILELTQLSTDTLAVLDPSARVIYLLPDYESTLVFTKKEAVVLKNNVSKDFYVTNPYSYKTYVNDESYSPEVTNVGGSYVAYVSELDKTYLEKDIRAFPSWGAMDLIDMGEAPEDTFWYRDRDKKEYGIIAQGETIDYDRVTSQFEGDDLVINYDDSPRYRLVDYKLTSSFVFKPVKLENASTSATSSTPSTTETGCTRGDCNSGFGRYDYDNGYYDGFWTGGLKNGYGLYSWNDGGTYVGNWTDDKMTGYGVYTADNDDIIKGEFYNGNLSGIGVTRTGEEWKQGTWSGGTQNAVYNFYGNDVDTGCTIGDCQDKYGKMVWTNGDTYVGFFKGGTMSIGTYSFADGSKYSGQFNTQGQFDGMGRFWFANDDYYGGEWSNGKYHGRGYYSFAASGEKQIGRFVNGVFQDN
ncbi:MAG: hypothetical protein ABJM06_14095 [Gilvibacter sp.]